MTHIDTIRKVGLFSSLGDEEVGSLAKLLQEKRVSKGSIVFSQGDVGDALYVLESGRLKVTTKDAQGRQRVLALYGSGDFFGEMALLSGQARSATISAVIDSNLLVLRKEDFEGFLARNISVMRHMLKVIAERQAQTNALLTKEATEDAELLSGRVITLYSPKGGVGRTTMAVNLATALRETTGKQVVLVDGSLAFGDVGVMLNLVASKSISDLVPHINELDYEILDSVIYYHASGIRVLLAPPQPELAELLTGDHIHIILTKLRDLFDYIVVDTSSALQESTLSILDASDLVLVLTTLEMAALKNVRVFVETTESLGYPSSKLVLAVNRSDSTGGIRIEAVEETVGRKFVGSIVSDGRLVTAAGNRGVPFVVTDKETRISSDVADLASATVAILEGRAVPERTPAGAVAPPKKRLQRMASAVVSQDSQTILFGLGAMFAFSIACLFSNMLISVVLQVTGVAYPSPLVAAGLLGISAFAGAFVAVRRGERRKPGWALGLVLGLLYGVLVAMVTASVADMAGDSITMTWPVVFSSIPVHGFLGLLGGTFGALGRRHLSYQTA